MNIQSDTTNSMQVSFNRLIIKKGSFDVLKQSENFPKDKNHPRYSDSMHDFYSKLIKWVFLPVARFYWQKYFYTKTLFSKKIISLCQY